MAADIAKIPLNARTVPFPMVDPFGPVIKARIPVPGLNRFPGRYNRLGRAFYLGMDDTAAPVNTEKEAIVNAGDEGNEEGFRGMGFTWGDFNPGYPGGTIPSGGIEYPSSQPGVLTQILGTLNNILPATISAIKGQPYYNTAPTNPVYNQGYNLGQQQLPGGAGANIGSQVGAAAGNIGDTFGNIVAQHPYLVMGGGLALLLLFMRPPGRR